MGARQHLPNVRAPLVPRAGQKRGVGGDHLGRYEAGTNCGSILQIDSVLARFGMICVARSALPRFTL